MKLKPKSTTNNVRALLYRRYTDIEKSYSANTVYITEEDNKIWVFDKESLSFIELPKSINTATANKIFVATGTTILEYANHKFVYLNFIWQETDTDELSLALRFANIGKYQTNKYYFVGSFDYVIKGSVEETTVQYIKGNKAPLQSFNIKHYNDEVNITPDDLVVIDNRLYAVEDVSTDYKLQPKRFAIHFATLTSIV